MKNIWIFLFVLFVAACTGADYPTSGAQLVCINASGAQNLEILVFDKKLMVSAGTGYTVDMKKVWTDNDVIKYEESQAGISALWNKNGEWIYFIAENPYTPSQKLYTGDNAMKCEIIQNFTKSHATEIYQNIPCVKDQCY